MAVSCHVLHGSNAGMPTDGIVEGWENGEWFQRFYRGGMMDELNLLNGTYDEAVAGFLAKYGPARDDYFSEKSYARFRNDEIKAPSKRNVSRTSEGLYCHHIDEDKQIMIASPAFIKEYDIPFDYQRRDRLVYCTLVEHGILHLLIAAETFDRLGELDCAPGVGGYVNFIRPNLIQWLIDGDEPRLPWQISCRNAIMMPREDAEKMIERMDYFLMDHYPLVTRETLETAYAKYPY